VYFFGLGVVRWVGYVLLVVAVVPLASAVVYLRKSRRGAYYAVRREALKKAQRWGSGAIIMLFVALGLLVLVRVLEGRVREQQIPTAIPVATQMPVRVDLPTQTASPAPTLRATGTTPFIPTFTPEVLPPAYAMSPLPSVVPAGPDARIAIMAVAAQKDENEAPVEPGVEFHQGHYPLYVFFEYGGMKVGYATTFVWYEGDEPLDSCLQQWVWGRAEDRRWGERGSAYLTCDPLDGWPVGNYEVIAFIDARVQSRLQFTIVQ